MNWIAYYTDNRMFRSDEVTWASLPYDGAIIIVEYKPTGRTLFNGKDWYWIENGVIKCIPSGPEWGTWQPKPKVRCRSCVKRGVFIPLAEFEELYERVFNHERAFNGD